MSNDRTAVGPKLIVILKEKWIGFPPILKRLSWTEPGKDSGWRPHIDGLRAVAVIAVLLYHSRPVDVPGGFIGVDVFFVISGLLISQVIYDDIATHGRFRLVNFYERRARRILPVAFGVPLILAIVMLWRIRRRK